MDFQLTVTLYSHHFVADQLTPRGRGCCIGFSKPLVAWTMQTKQGFSQRLPDKVYAASDAARQYFRFHINLLEKFKAYLIENQVPMHQVNFITAPPAAAVPVTLEVQERWKEKPDQVDHIKYLVESTHPSRLLSRQTGTGKAAPLTSKILTPDGFIPMGEIKMGDPIVAWDNSIAHVSGVYPQGSLAAWTVLFEDGRKTQCSDDHQWGIYDSPTEGVREVMTLQRVVKELEEGRELYVDLCQPIDLSPHQNHLEVAEWSEQILTSFKLHGAVDLNASLSQVFKTIDELAFDAKAQRAKLDQINAYFLKTQTIKDRLQLVQTLLYDGSTVYCAEDAMHYSTPSWGRAMVLVELIRSLGGVARHDADYPQGVGSRSIQLNVAGLGEAIAVPQRRLRINAAIQIGMEPMQCLSITHPDQLYITDDFIVTHNTFCALAAIAKLGLRPCIVIKSMYIDKWIEDVLKTYKIAGPEIMVIKGQTQLKSALFQGEEGRLNAKVIIISITTLQDWITKYEDHGSAIFDEGYAVAPDKFFETIGAGVKLVDEVHQHFHQMFKLDLYTHVQHSISLSATLLSQDLFMSNMYEIMFPRRTRPAELALKKYIDSYAVHYDLVDPTKIRTQEYGSNSYSHNAFEKSIMRHVPTKLAYFRLIDYVMHIGFFKVTRPKKRLAVYASTIEMCTQLTAWFKHKYPDLDIRRYCDDDPYENMMEADIRFSTIGSGGTALDIPDLTTVILTNNLSSIQGNIQVLGRLRDLGDSPVEFYYLTAVNLPKHVTYHRAKVDMLRERAKSFRDVFSGMRV